MVEHISDWLGQYQTILMATGLASTLIFILSLLALPWLVSKIPADYFSRSPNSRSGWADLLRPNNIVRNLLGIPILLAGISMLILPGQGILTILAGIAIMEFPGKFRLERWLVHRPGVMKTLNWLRRKANVPELYPIGQQASATLDQSKQAHQAAPQTGSEK